MKFENRIFFKLKKFCRNSVQRSPPCILITATTFNHKRSEDISKGVSSPRRNRAAIGESEKHRRLFISIPISGNLDPDGCQATS